MSFLLIDAIEDLETTYFLNQVNSLCITILSGKTFLTNPNFFSSLEYTDLCNSPDSSENEVSLSWSLYINYVNSNPYQHGWNNWVNTGAYSTEPRPTLPNIYQCHSS